MGHPAGEPHTLAQLARRAGISEGRARALYTAKPSGLPSPDRVDADGRPLWWASTVDAWCARTGREVSQDALWLFRAPAASSPATELRRGVVTSSGRRAQPFYSIVWDTALGHVIYLQPLEDTGGAHRDWLAVAAAQLIEPRWWSSAVVVMPYEEVIGRPIHGGSPQLYVYRLGEADDGRVGGPAPARGRRSWFGREDTAAATGPAKARAVWEGLIDVAELAAVVGRPIPLWLQGTNTVSNAAQVVSSTFTTADTATEWPATQERLMQAVRAELPARFPAGFAALAADAADELIALRKDHEATADSGPGWYLACRPARPSPPVELEQSVAGAVPVSDSGQVAAELAQLRRLEGELDYEDPAGDVYAKVIDLLAWQLRKAAADGGATRSYSDYVAVADDGWLTYSAPWEGPVVEAWRENLTPLGASEREEVCRLRRVRRLLADYEPQQVQEVYREPDGRFVLVIDLDNGEESRWSLAEWPASLEVVASWNDKTVLAADDPTAGAVTLLALTPAGGRRTRTDPVPLSPRSDREAFGYGYSGGTPITSYEALLRVALGDGVDLAAILDWLTDQHGDGRTRSQLWEVISTTTGPLRLSWPQLRLWARADRKAAGADGPVTS